MNKKRLSLEQNYLSLREESTLNTLDEQEHENEKQNGINNVNAMRMGGVSETTINDQVYKNKMQEIDVLEKSGSITHEEAQRQRAEAMHNRDLKNIDIMQKSGVVSQVSINNEKERSEKQYSQNLQEIENICVEQKN